MCVCVISTAGNIGAELSYNNVGMFISSDAGNTWRPVSLTPTFTPTASRSAAVSNFDGWCKKLNTNIVFSGFLLCNTFSFHSSWLQVTDFFIRHFRHATHQSKSADNDIINGWIIIVLCLSVWLIQSGFLALMNRSMTSLTSHMYLWETCPPFTFCFGPCSNFFVLLVSNSQWASGLNGLQTTAF